jgi:dienelactone hydrolase
MAAPDGDSPRMDKQGSHPTQVDDPLDDFQHREVTLEQVTRRVYVSGLGPAVIVMPEMPGISPDVARFARWVRQAGFCVYLPSLFGRDGAVPETDAGIEVFRRTCVSAEFRALAGGGARPVTRWLCALARQAHGECGGPGVGVVGMCFTGNFALTMVLEPAVIAPVVAQPSLPLEAPASVDMSAQELAAVRARLERDDLTVLAYRFEGDAHCRAERFAAYRQALGPRFIARVLPDSAANPEPSPFFRDVVKTPHSVLTAHLIDADGQPTVEARDEVLAFLHGRLHADNVRDAPFAPESII